MNSKILALFFVGLLSIGAEAQAAGAGCVTGDCDISRADYERVMDNFRTLYPSVSFIARWGEDRPQAFASFRRVTMSGGFARKDDINLGGFLIVSCHEVGHALFRHNEGEADYFSTKTCMKDYLNTFGEDVIRLSVGAGDNLFNACNTNEDSSLCVATIMASQNAAQAGANRCVKRLRELEDEVMNSNRRNFSVENFFFRCLRTLPEVVTPSFSRQDLLASIAESIEILNAPMNLFVEDARVVTRSYSQHNSPLCRMQTLRQGYFNLPEPMCWKRQ